MSFIYLSKPRDFKINCEVSTVFMQHDQKLLVLLRSHSEESSRTWAIPGGKLEINETPLKCLIREIKEELDLKAPEHELTFKYVAYVNHPKIQYVLHVYQWHLETMPDIKLNQCEHESYRWQPIKRFDELKLLDGQLEAFNLIYGSSY